ncbi:hypothetical protein [Undibacterium sp. RuRC25W]|uniref:hypothetical protein n=1 Tax=Undibacterium sp. RuRC25W TaxID=3413047 RepID=UPI003BF1CEB0
MKTLKFAALFCLGFCVMGSSYAWPRHHGGPRVGFGLYLNPLPLMIGAPYYSPNYYYGNPYYAYPQEVVVRAPIVTYSTPIYTTAPAPSYDTYEVQPGITSQSSSDGKEWLYCNQPDGFYPAVKECPGGWRRIVK